MSTSGRRRSRPRCAVLLTPGAGSGRDHPSLVAIEEALAPAGVPVARLDFPYRKAGRRAPDRLPVLVAAVRDGASELTARAGVAPGSVVVGGRSLGGRVCSVAVAEASGHGLATTAASAAEAKSEPAIRRRVQEVAIVNSGRRSVARPP